MRSVVDGGWLPLSSAPPSDDVGSVYALKAAVERNLARLGREKGVVVGELRWKENGDPVMIVSRARGSLNRINHR